MHWMRNIRDWCLSRQLWWGHRIPVWYRGEEVYCGMDAPQGDGWQQDPDVLDTWFSSWLWPFATMGWPEKTDLLKKFYPTSDLVTGPDIIFLWVARMIMAGYEYMDEKPFSNVYFHGIIRDAHGVKMKKSLGNSPDPLDLIAKYGADGLRFGLMLIAPQGQDVLFDEKRCEIGRNFMNKLWNAARFIQLQKAQRGSAGASPSQHSAHDLKVLFEMNRAIDAVSNALDEYRFNEAAKDLYEFVWGDFCDWYIEASKVAPNVVVLEEVLRNILRLLHPFAPFITEELWTGMGGTGSIMFAPWPTPRAITGATTELASKVEELYEVVVAGRQLRNDYGIEPKKKITFAIKPDNEGAFFQKEIGFLKQLLNADEIKVDPTYTPDGLAPSLVVKAATIFMVGAVNAEAERQRLEKQLVDIEKQLSSTDAKLANESFVSRAASIAVQRERDKQLLLREQRGKVQALLRTL